MHGYVSLPSCYSNLTNLYLAKAMVVGSNYAVIHMHKLECEKESKR